MYTCRITLYSVISFKIIYVILKEITGGAQMATIRKWHNVMRRGTGSSMTSRGIRFELF